MLAEFNVALNAYLKDLVSSSVRSLADVIAFNNSHKDLEKIDEYGQDLLLQSQKTKGIDNSVKLEVKNLQRFTKIGFEKLMLENKLDAPVTPGTNASLILAIGGFPGISVPAGYDSDGVSFGICFGCLKGSEPKHIEIAFGFEQATKVRKPPPILIS